MLEVINRIKFLQINLNRHWTAQNLLMQSIYELNIDVACVSKPALALQASSRWIVSTDALAAIYFGTSYLTSKCVIYNINRNFVVVKYK